MLNVPPFGTFRLNPLRLCFRTAYVMSTTAVAMVFPYFNQVLGVLGGINFWPLTIYFPVEMYLKQANIRSWTPKWVMLRTFTIIFLIVTVFALIGSIQGLVSAKLSWGRWHSISFRSREGFILRFPMINDPNFTFHENFVCVFSFFSSFSFRCALITSLRVPKFLWQKIVLFCFTFVGPFFF